MQNQKTLSVIILAGGKGARMRSSLPKVLHTLAGKPLLSHVLDKAKSLYPEQLIVVDGHQGDRIRETFAKQNLRFVRQSQQLGTGDALKTALPFLTSTTQTLVLSGDVPLMTLKTLQDFIQQTPENTIGVLTTQMDNPYGLGRVVKDDGGKIQIIEEKDANVMQKKINEINAGVYLFPTTKLNKLTPYLNVKNNQKEYYLTDMINHANLESMPVKTICLDNPTEVMGINDQSELAKAERFYQKQLANHFMLEGVLIRDPNRFDVRGNLQCGQGVEIDLNAVFVGEVVLGNQVKIGANVILKDTVVGDNTEVLPFCHVEGATIKSGVTIGPFARVREGSVLEEGSKLGNFVEIKKTTLGKKTKANHLSYLGDAMIGDNVNIGAGTITCNYDGKNKHKTVIEDNVFVGSDTQLVAPVVVKQGATIAAGTTVLKDVPESSLSLNPKEQQNKTDWKRR